MATSCSFNLLRHLARSSVVRECDVLPGNLKVISRRGTRHSRRTPITKTNSDHWCINYRYRSALGGRAEWACALPILDSYLCERPNTASSPLYNKRQGRSILSLDYRIYWQRITCVSDFSHSNLHFIRPTLFSNMKTIGPTIGSRVPSTRCRVP